MAASSNDIVWARMRTFHRTRFELQRLPHRSAREGETLAVSGLTAQQPSMPPATGQPLPAILYRFFVFRATHQAKGHSRGKGAIFGILLASTRGSTYMATSTAPARADRPITQDSI